MEIIEKIIKTLNVIEVRGAENLDRLLGCIQGLERLNAAIDAQEAKGNEDRNEPEQNVYSPLD